MRPPHKRGGERGANSTGAPSVSRFNEAPAQTRGGTISASVNSSRPARLQ